MNNQKLLLVPIILTIAVASVLLVLSPSINAQAQMYDDRNEYSNDYNKAYSHDDKNSKKNSGPDIQKLKCVNSNLNLNGIDINQIPTDDLATAEAANEGGADATGAQNGNGWGDKINFERNLVNVCVNINDNQQIKISGPAPEPSTLTVIKHVSCEDLTISGTDVSVQQEIDLCAALLGLVTADQYLIDVIGNHPKPAQFGGSETGTAVKLGPGNYQVKELVTESVVNEVGLFKQQNPNIDVILSAPTLSGDCLVGSAGNGIIGEGESQTCNIENQFTIEPLE